MNERVLEFRFMPHRWADPVHLHRILQEGGMDPTHANPDMQKFALQRYIPNVSPAIFERFENRLLLLTKEEWTKLAVGVALAPLAGRVRKSLDGYVRRLALQHLTQEQAEQFDAVQWEHKPSTRLLSWRDEGAVIQGAQVSIMATCQWDDALRVYNNLRFPLISEESNTDNLTLEHIGDICKILLPDLSWL